MIHIRFRWSLFFTVSALLTACTPFSSPPDAGNGSEEGDVSIDAGDGAAGLGDSGGAEIREESGGEAVSGTAGEGGGGGSVRDGGPGEDALADAGAEVAQAVCGDGMVTPPEECDLGAAANTGAYGACTKDCKLAPRCGDDKVNDVSEVCDEGANNGFAVGGCNPACSGLVTVKRILATSMYMFAGALGGVEDAEIICRTEFGSQFRSMLVDGKTRIASRTPYKGDGQLDWVLNPYTRYVNSSGDLIWTTDSVALLGVRDGKSASLVGPIRPGGYALAWAGVEADWTSSAANCEQWQSEMRDSHGNAIRLESQTLTFEPATCDLQLSLVCVER